METGGSFINLGERGEGGVGRGVDLSQDIGMVEGK